MDPNYSPDGGLATPDQIIVQQTPLSLPLSDDMILQTLSFAEQRGKSVRSQLRIDERTSTNVNFWKGQQVASIGLDTRYQEMHVDNVSRQNLENKIKLATGHTPDIFCVPPDRQGFNTEAANHLQAYMRDRFDNSTNKRLLKNGLRKMDLEFIAVIKPRWDALHQRSVFELVDSKNLLFGEGSRVYEDGFTIEGTHILFHYVEEETQQVLNRFPKKAQELLSLLGAQGKEIPSRITYTEAHFDWYDQQGNCNQGVACRYGTLILDSFKQPYYNYENKQVNYFDRARKNFILFSYANLGESPYESTTDFEQMIPLNRIINRRRRQITEISDRAVPKLGFVGGAMTKELAENISPNPNEAIILDENYSGDDIRKAMFIIPGTPPSPILYQDLLDLRGRANSITSTHGTTTGENPAASQSGVSKQISREGDLVTSDDIVDVTLERIIFEMASWEMQFLRLFRDNDRPPYRITNGEGETQYVELNREKIETDIQVTVKASSMDKQTRRADAIQLLGAQAIDPYTLLEDLDVPNPRERLRRLVAFLNAMRSGSLDGYMEQLGIDPETPFATAEDAARDISILQTGNEVMAQMPGESYVAAFQTLIKSPEFQDPSSEKFTPYAKQLIMMHVMKLKMLVDQAAQKAQQQSQQQGGINPNAPGQVQPGGAQGVPSGMMPTTAAAFQGGQNPSDFSSLMQSLLARGTAAQA
jgi:hypothetical protein